MRFRSGLWTFQRYESGPKSHWRIQCRHRTGFRVPSSVVVMLFTLAGTPVPTTKTALNHYVSTILLDLKEDNILMAACLPCLCKDLYVFCCFVKSEFIFLYFLFSSRLSSRYLGFWPSDLGKACLHPLRVQNRKPSHYLHPLERNQQNRHIQRQRQTTSLFSSHFQPHQRTQHVQVWGE